MKKLIFALIVIGGLAGLVWWLWLKPGKHEEEEAKIETLVPVQVGKIERATLHAYVTAYGVVEPEPAGARPAASARLMAAVAGVIAAVKGAEGQRVEQGATLFQLDTRLVDVAVTFAAQNVERQQKLVQAGGSSQKALLEAEQQLRTAQLQRTLLEVKAPLTGVITRLNVKPGEAVDLTTTLAEMVDLDRLVVSANIPSAELAQLHAGQPAEVCADATAPVSGTLSYISPQVDSKTGTAPVRVALPANSALRPGQFVTLRIVSAEHKDCLAVPFESVVRTEDGGTVIAVVQNGKATQTPVKAGLRDGGLVEVEGAGLSAGLTVVTVGAYGLPKETKIRVLNPTPTEQPAPAAGTSLLELKQTIPLPEVKGGFDLMAADVAGQRLFVNAEDNNTTEVVDLAAGKRTHTITGMHEPKWVVYRPESHKLYVANGDGAVRVLDSESFAPIRSITFKEKANNLRYDPQTQELFVGVGKTFGALGIVDTHSDTITAQIALANYPKQFEIDGNLLYVNIPKANHIAVVDRTKREVVATWPVKEAKDNVPMALDRANHRLFVGCASGKLVVFDIATGQSVASLDINAEPDGIYCDTVRQLIYVSCGVGSIDVISQADADHYTLAERVPTAKGAATSLFVPELHRLILAVPQHDQQVAELRVFQAGS